MIKHSICHPPDCLVFIITCFVDSPRSHAQFTDESNFCVAAVKSCIFKKARIIHNKMIDFPTNPLSLETTFSLQTLNQFSVYCETHLHLLLFVMFSLINCIPKQRGVLRKGFNGPCWNVTIIQEVEVPSRGVSAVSQGMMKLLILSGLHELLTPPPNNNTEARWASPQRQFCGVINSYHPQGADVLTTSLHDKETQHWSPCTLTLTLNP